ncbi:hypothetical protein Tco_0798897 [Tanacetum coccineum]
MVLIISYQNLLSHVNGVEITPPTTIVQNDKTVVNPDLASLMAADHRTVIILHASLFEEAVSMIVGLTTAHDISAALELTSYADSATPIDDTLACAFHAQCHVSSVAPDWYVDSGASNHMATSSDYVSNPKPPTGSSNNSGPSTGLR